MGVYPGPRRRNRRRTGLPLLFRRLLFVPLPLLGGGSGDTAGVGSLERFLFASKLAGSVHFLELRLQLEDFLPLDCALSRASLEASSMACRVARRHMARHACLATYALILRSCLTLHYLHVRIGHQDPPPDKTVLIRDVAWRVIHETYKSRPHDSQTCPGARHRHPGGVLPIAGFRSKLFRPGGDWDNIPSPLPVPGLRTPGNNTIVLHTELIRWFVSRVFLPWVFCQGFLSLRLLICGCLFPRRIIRYPPYLVGIPLSATWGRIRLQRPLHPHPRAIRRARHPLPGPEDYFLLE